MRLVTLTRPTTARRGSRGAVPKDPGEKSAREGRSSQAMPDKLHLDKRFAIHGRGGKRPLLVRFGARIELRIGIEGGRDL